MEEQLKPCPFCGSKDVKINYLEDENYEVVCNGCQKGIYFQTNSKEKAIDIFNQRAKPENKPLTIDELRGIGHDITSVIWVVKCDEKSTPSFNTTMSAIIDYDKTVCGNLIALTGYGMKLLLEKDYGKTWLAYRYKPEQEDA